MCSLDHLQLGLCLDVLRGLVHLGAGNPIENACCSVLHGPLALEAAVCLCTAITLRILNLDIYNFASVRFSIAYFSLCPWFSCTCRCPSRRTPSHLHCPTAHGNSKGRHFPRSSFGWRTAKSKATSAATLCQFMNDKSTSVSHLHREPCCRFPHCKHIS
ncbi:hypothetical protein BHE74_00048450 [Ensete ventricosum]|nr:hypothetical protein GW17_00035615 [Ensete ventricosum]RWW45691.1 hypothetical protein BHE74_00048450 [Ensete ventricosum]